MHIAYLRSANIDVSVYVVFCDSESVAYSSASLLTC